MPAVDDPFAGRAQWFAEHYRSTRGRARLELVLGRLLEALPEPPAEVLDAGGGTGAFSIPLAERGYRVTVLDRSREWLDQAEESARGSGVELTLVEGRVEEVRRVVDGEFDALLCHTVLAYSEEPEGVLTALRSVARPGATLSVLEKNRLALPVRPGLQADYAEARRLLDEPLAAGRLGIVNRAYYPAELRAMLLRTGWRPGGWAGIRVFSDQAREEVEEDTFAAILSLERAAFTREPYRRMGRLVHLLGVADDAPPPLHEVQRISLSRASPATRESWPEEDALSPSELRAFLDRKRYGILSTTRPTGRPHAAMIAFLYRDGRFWLPAVAGSVRVRNAEHEPAASLVVTEGEGPQHIAVVIEGDALVHHDVEPILSEFLFDAWRRRFGSELDWAGAMIELLPRRVLSHRSRS